VRLPLCARALLLVLVLLPRVLVLPTLRLLLRLACALRGQAPSAG
jgi:hypothetical protein